MMHYDRASSADCVATPMTASMLTFRMLDSSTRQPQAKGAW